MKILGRFWPYINLKKILYRKVKSPIKHYSIPPPQKEKTMTKAIQDICREENQVHFTTENPYIFRQDNKDTYFLHKSRRHLPHFWQIIKIKYKKLQNKKNWKTKKPQNIRKSKTLRKPHTDTVRKRTNPFNPPTILNRCDKDKIKYCSQT